MRVTVLGCGGSAGVPMIGRAGGYWGACDPANPRNRRRRVSILIEDQGQTILIDTSPDLREQLLAADVTRLDAVLYTHDHADHINGIDELRHIRVKGRNGIDCYGTAATMAPIAARFRYAFEQNEVGSGVLYRPFLNRHDISGPFAIGPVPIVPFAQDHGLGSTTTGYRVGDMAYSTDAVELPDEVLDDTGRNSAVGGGLLARGTASNSCASRQDLVMDRAYQAAASDTHAHEPYAGLRGRTRPLPAGR